MADISVLFSRQGGIVAIRWQQPVMAHETIAWHIVSENPEVKKARLRFAKAGDRFFLRGKKRVNLAFQSIDAASSSTVIWGIAPAPRKEAVRWSKYTVEGLDKKGGVVVSIDPEIIIVAPGPGLPPTRPAGT